MTDTWVPLKHVAAINERALADSTDPDYEFRYVDIGSVGRGKLLAEPSLMRFVDAPSRARRLVREGDTVVSTVRTYLRAVWPVKPPTEDLVVSTGFAVLSPKDLEPGYFAWWVQSDAFIEEVVARSVGVSYPAINALELGELQVRVPSPVEQQAIASYLDCETARIDNLMAKKLRMLELLEERRWQVPRAEICRSAPAQVPLRRALLSIVDGPFGSAFASADYVDEGAVSVVRLGNIGFAEWRGQDVVRLPEERFAEFAKHRVEPGNLLFAGLGDASNHAGRACVAPDLGLAIVKGKCFCAQVDPELAVADYLALFCSSPEGASAIGLEARGSTRSMINLDIVKSVMVPLPDVPRQQEIVLAVRTAWERNKDVQDRLRSQLGLLDEHRQALITSAVTGKLAVSELAT